jgi:hypothetical protein
MSISREELVEELVQMDGLPPEEAEREAEKRLVDDDLWVCHPMQRFIFEPEEAVAEWEQTANFAGSLAEGFTIVGDPGVNTATIQLFWDMHARAEEALRRARERAQA